MTQSKTFCILPWMHLATTASGNLRVCCNSTSGKNVITKEDGSSYKLHEDDLEEAWNSKVYTTIRKQMINGDRPEMCQRCFGEEDVGITSARQSWNKKWQDDGEYTTDAPFDIKYVDLRLGNLCNLKCRMCNPYASNMWVKEWHLINDALSESEYKRLSNMNWPEKEKTWENLFSIAHTVDEIYLTGGEPTVIKEQQRLLDYFINNGTAKDIRLKYNTNLVKLPPWLLERWTHFKRVQLNCSIDATGALDHYIRYPSNWDTIVKNFEKIRELPNAGIEIHCTVQMYNILRLPELINWAEPYGHKIYFNILNHPEELNIRVLPVHLKDQAATQLHPYLHLEKVQGIIDYMYAEDWNDKYDKFLSYTAALDKSRDEKLIDIIPELVYNKV
jgi:molybdenum cofactor biosynthesis enzyme MoaA